jgi:UDP-glucose 4-epimerase
MAVLRAVEQITGRTVPYQMAPRRDGDAAELVADSRKLQRELGWKPKRSSLQELVRDSWEFFQQNSGLPISQG